MGDGRGFFACRASRGQGYNDQIMIEYNGFEGFNEDGSGGWAVLVQGNRREFDSPDTRGAGAYYDKTFVDRQIGFGIPGQDGDSNTHMRLFIEDYELGLLKKGSRFKLDVNGEAVRSWSLAGLTAAILKVAECADKWFGTSLTARPVAKPAPQKPVQARTTGKIDGFSVGTVSFPNGDFRKTGHNQWQEQGSNGNVFYFSEYDRSADSVFLEDRSRNIQIWIDLPAFQISFTQNHDYNRWERLYPIDCFGGANSRSC